MPAAIVTGGNTAAREVAAAGGRCELRRLDLRDAPGRLEYVPLR